MVLDGDAFSQYFEAEEEIPLAKRKRNFQETPLFSSDGMPTSQFVWFITSQFFDSLNKDINLKNEANRLDIQKDLLEIIFRQLEEMDIITETNQGNFRYNLNCKDYKFQAKVEKGLLDVMDTTKATLPYRTLPFYPGDKPPNPF